MDPKQKRLRLMRFWLFGSFVIVWAAVTAYIAMFTGDFVGAMVAGLPIWGITGIAAIVLYVAYNAWLRRQPG